MLDFEELMNSLPRGFGQRIPMAKPRDLNLEV